MPNSDFGFSLRPPYFGWINGRWSNASSFPKSSYLGVIWFRIFKTAFGFLIAQAIYFIIRNGQFQTIELKDNSGANVVIEAMVADTDDPLLVATQSGLFRWDGRRWTVLDANNGLPCKQLVSIVKDAHGSLWIGAYCGLLKIDTSELARWRRDADVKVAVKAFDRLDGAYPGRKDIGQPYATRAPNGRIWFANGFEVETCRSGTSLSEFRFASSSRSKSDCRQQNIRAFVSSCAFPRAPVIWRSTTQP